MISLSHNEAFFIDEAPLSFVKSRLSVLFIEEMGSILKNKKCVFDAVEFFFRSLIMCPEFSGYNVVRGLPVEKQYNAYNLTNRGFSLYSTFIRKIM